LENRKQSDVSMATPQHPLMQGTPPLLSLPSSSPLSPLPLYPGQRALTTVAALSSSVRFFRARFQAGRRLSRREPRRKNARCFSIPLAMIYVTRRIRARRDIGSTLLAADVRYKSLGIIIIIFIIIIIIIIIIVATEDATPISRASLSPVLAVMPTTNRRSTSSRVIHRDTNEP